MHFSVAHLELKQVLSSRFIFAHNLPEAFWRQTWLFNVSVFNLGKSGFSQVQSRFSLTYKIGNIGIRGFPQQIKKISNKMSAPVGVEPGTSAIQV